MARGPFSTWRAANTFAAVLRALFARFRQFNRQRQQQRRMVRLSATDARALAGQAAPDPGRVLVVRNDSIGDYLLYRPWLRQLSAAVRGRGQRLTLVANALWAPLAQAWDADLLDELVVVAFGSFQKDLAYRAEILRTLGAAGYGEVIYPLHVREPAVENFIRFLLAPRRVASQGEHRTDAWFRALDAGYTHLLPTVPGVLFEYERNREFFEHWSSTTEAGVADAKKFGPPLRLPASVLAARAPSAAGQAYVVLFPGASARQKRWPAAHFARVAAGLHQRYGERYRLVLAGSPADAAHARQIQRAAGAAVPLDDRCGQTDLPGLAALISGAALLLSNDTVAAHLGAQAGVPGITVLMGENYGKFFPYPPALLGAPSRCFFPPDMEARFAAGNFSRPDYDPDIAQISPARVLAAAVALLEMPA